MCIIGATYSECVRMAGPGPNYALTANVDAKSLSGLGAAGYRLCLVKGGVQGSSGGVQLPIVWVSSVAFESNRMEWDQNSYDIYASTQGIQQGVILTAQSSTSGVDQSKLYTFSNGVFTASSDLATPGYVMQNDMSQYYTFGLQQSTMHVQWYTDRRCSEWDRGSSRRHGSISTNGSSDHFFLPPCAKWTDHIR